MRKIFQDLVAPELQSLHAKIDGLEKTVDAKFGTVDAKLFTVDAKLEAMSQRISSMERETNLRFQNAEERSSARQEIVLARLETFAAKIGARFDAVEKKAELDKAEILNALQTERRIKSLEERVFAPTAQPAMQGAPFPIGPEGAIVTGALGTQAKERPGTK